MNLKTNLIVAKTKEEMSMSSGSYTYDFSGQLPLKLPEALEGKHGHIRYNVEAILDVPWRFDKKFKIPFTIERSDDLNEFPELKDPSKVEEIKRFRCLFCRSGPLIVTVTLPCSGFVPGQRIPVTVSYNNNSDIEVKKTRIYLKRIIKFTALCQTIKTFRMNHCSPTSASVFESKVIVEASEDGVMEGDGKNFTRELLLPQEMLKTNSRFSKIIEVSYELKVEAKTSGVNRNIKVMLPVTIGSVPFNQDKMKNELKSEHTLAY